MPDALPGHAQTVIIGGGSIGVNTAYHLTKLGHTDVVVLEQGQLTSGTTWHAAGLIVAGLLTSEADCQIYNHGRDLYKKLEAETGIATGFREVGYLQIATNEERVHEMRRVAAFMRRFGIENHEIPVSEAAEMFPGGNFSDVMGAFYIPEDGRANPVDVTMSLAKGARMGAARIFENAGVEQILERNGTVTGVRTADSQVITAENAVLCAGMWSRQLAERHEVNLPLQAAEHYYLITEPIPGLPRDLPMLEDPSTWIYYREEVGGMMLGFFEPKGAAWKLDDIPDDWQFGEIDLDWDRVGPDLELAYSRVPDPMSFGVRKLFCGPESFTPDLAPLVGPVPELRNLWVACGMNSLGILNGAGTGMVLAHWIVDGLPPIDVTGINVNRFSRSFATPAFRRDRTPELLGKSFGQHYPNEGFKTARDVKRSVLHDRLKAAGAGRDLGVRNAGMQTLKSLRLEKAYRDFGIDVDNTDNPIEAGLGFAVKLDKPGGFIGRDALAAIKAEGVPKTRMLQFLLQDPEPLLHGKELIYLGEDQVGYIQVGGYGHTLGGAVGIGFAELSEPLTAEIVETGGWQIEIADRKYPATASLKPLYDPKMTTIRC